MRFSVLCCFAALTVLVSAKVEGPLVFTAHLHRLQLATGRHTIPLLPREPNHPMLQGDSGEPDDTSPLLQRRSRLGKPELAISVDPKGYVDDIEVYLGHRAFAAPPFRLHIFAEHTKQTLNDHFFGGLPPNATGARQTIPGSFHQVSRLPEAMVTELVFSPQAITTYVYDMPNGIPEAVLDSFEMYDLVPSNASMLTKFLIQRHAPTEDDIGGSLSLWVNRKPPMPSFELLLVVDGEVIANANVVADKVGTDALGFDIHLTGETLDALRTRHVSVVAHFFERYREKVALATVENMRTAINQLKKTTDFRTFESSVHNLKVRLHYTPGTGLLGLKVLQPEPMSAVLITLYYMDADGSRRVMLREEDDVVPFYPDQTNPLQFGWDDAIPTDPAAVTVDGKDFLDQPVEIEVAYNPIKGSPKEEASTGVLLQKWIGNYGGDASNLDLHYLDTPDHSHAVKHHVRTHAPVDTGHVIASIPYACLLTANHVERSIWAPILNKSVTRHEAHVKSQQIHPSARRIMELTIAVLLHLFEESTNFRLYFNTFGVTGHKLPLFYSEAEMKLFDFDSELKTEVNRMKALWDIEFQVLEEASSMLPRHVTKDQYFKVRSQVEARLLNLSSSLVLPPVIDLLTHSDDPSAIVEYDDHQNAAFIVARRDIPHRGIVSVDFGRLQKTKFDFLLQFGFVPPGAIDAVAIRVDNVAHPVNRYLTRAKDSREAIVRALAGATPDEDPEADDGEPLLSRDDREAALKAFETIVRQKLTAMPQAVNAADKLKGSRVAKYAERLLQSEREVLNEHLKFLQE